jgi:hypothetical protein
MSADGSVKIVWGGEERRFRLAIGQLRELQETINRNRGEHPIGPWSLLQLVMKGDAWPDDLREVLRLGLIGGGAKSHLVPGLLKRYFEEQPLLWASVPCLQILKAALIGDESDPVTAKKNDSETTETMSSNSPSSTDQAQQWASALDKSMTARSGNSQHVSRDTIEQTEATPTISPTQ